MDGVGVAPQSPANAVTLATTQNLDSLWPKYPHTYLYASGINVGLPHGVDGNSEVGHMNIGAGKIIFQELPRIDNSINNGSFFKNDHLLKAFARADEHKIHIIGLVGAGQVHASFGHLLALIDMARKLKVEKNKLMIHLFTDGRDSPPRGAYKIIENLEIELKRDDIGQIATIVGRYYAMDRDERWDRTKLAYDLITEGKGKYVENWRDALKESYKNNVSDEYITPYVIGQKQEFISKVEPGDAVIYFNFRPDRAVQLTRAFEDPAFPGWDRPMINDIYFVGMSNYEKGFPYRVAFPPENIINPLGKVLSDNGLRQLRLAESEKFPHVTYFMNGRNQKQYPGEDWVEVPSPRDVATYDQKPEMSTYVITDVLIEKIQSDFYDFIVANFANADMVGHTGVINATVTAMQVIDECIGKICEAVLAKNGAIIISADHGNAEELINQQTGQVDTKHSTNPVPLVIIKKDLEPRELSFGILADIAPTIISLLGLPKPPEMTGRNLLA
jgi:2,3-bisphosphoglycerate-independent phosphoglycerate mutase